MPVTRRRLCAIVGALLVGAQLAHAQTLPRRENVETAIVGDVDRALERKRHVLEVAPHPAALVPVDGSRFVDLRLHAGPAPQVWSSAGGALFVQRPLQPAGPDRFTIDTAEPGPRWLVLDAADEARVELHTRIDGARGGADPWLVPIAPTARRAVRTRADRRDRVLELTGTEPAVYRINGRRDLRVDLWRAQVPRLLPPDASWLRIEADGRTIFEGRAPAPAQRERLHVTDGCAQVLDLAGRLRIAVPAQTRELRVFGEPGTWLKLLAPLPGAPVEALGVDADPHLDRLIQRPGEPLQAAFERAVAAYPDPRAQTFLGRYSYYRAVAVQPADGAALHTRLLRPRFPDRSRRETFESNRPTASTPGPGPLAFHWLAPGARWRLDAGRAGAGLLRLSVAHPASPADARLQLSQPGGAVQTLRLDAAAIAALEHAPASADALLALAPAGAAIDANAGDEDASPASAPIVDASQSVLPHAPLAAPLTLENTGDVGVWVAVDQRVPATRALADATLDSAAITPAQVRDALLDAPLLQAADQHDALGATRSLEAARRLLDARRRRFADEPCVQAAYGSDPTRALDVFAHAQSVDPVLARCAVLQVAATAPDDARVVAALKQWAERTGQGEMLTGFHAWAVQRAAPGAEAVHWQSLASALEAEGEFEAAAFARRAAGTSELAADAAGPNASGAIPATSSAGIARLRSERDTELAYARADGRPARWVLERPGPHTLELRSLAPAPQWAQLRSGGRTWSVRLPAADAEATALRDLAGDAAPSLGVRIAFDVAAAGQALEVSSEVGGVIARVEALVAAGAGVFVAAPVDAGVRPVRVDVADRCTVDRTAAPLPIARIGAPAQTNAASNPTPVAPAPDAPVLDPTAPDAPRTATQAALQALQTIESGRLDAAQATAARAIALRGDAADAPAAPGVFAELDRHLTWRRLTPVAHGGAVSREVADGRSSNPLIARREQWAGATDDARFVLRPGQGWVLDGLQPHQPVQLTLQLRAALDDAVEVRAADAAPRRLQAGEAAALAVRADQNGALRVRVGDALPGTFVDLTVADAAGRVIDPRRPLRYHRGPVEVALTEPTVLRIVEWNGRSSAVRTQWVAQAGTVRLQPQQLPGAALRVTALHVDPAPPRTPAPAETATASAAPALRTAPLVPAPAPPWPDAWPASGGEDGTWGVLASVVQRTDADNPDARRERFGELRWRYRYRIADQNLWGRLDAVGRRHDLDFGVIGLEHDLQWRQDDGPWGASLDASVWQQRAPVGLDSPARSINLRAAIEWSRRRDERWRDEWSLGVRARDLSLRNVPRSQTARLDNDVYSRYRDRHRSALDLGVRVAWRARYDSELVFDAQAISNPLSDFGLDQAGAGVAWRWTRRGWTASAGLDVRHYLRDARRAQADTRNRVELALGRLFLGHDTGWRLRLAGGYDTATRDTQVGLTVEWFDHDGRGLSDWWPSELFLRNIVETDLVAPLVPPDPLP
ncbi:hypothetical protein [Cognatilysobacter bugurensis]|uniref:Uncharacterized protein n=1 Tax=Cognatilysobacter bugurensis TaxID=543356 RepID=A0A918SZ73_9GAMM|nr:hypothetical protein [Lysobacter bugurensis]GHA80164.1 hypothetical protein GCM10007067_17310 [Lysobacter bugurensis]